MENDANFNVKDIKLKREKSKKVLALKSKEISLLEILNIGNHITKTKQSTVFLKKIDFYSK